MWNAQLGKELVERRRNAICLCQQSSTVYRQIKNIACVVLCGGFSWPEGFSSLDKKY